MFRLIASLFILIFWLPLIGQSENPDTQIPEKTLNQIKWVNNLYEHGISTEGDSLLISAEVNEILNNPELMDFMFPQEYSWQAVVFLLEKMELKKAFWFLINLYPENKEPVMATVMKYDSLFDMNKILTSTFYTYSMIDPVVCEITDDGKPEIKRPDLAEAKLQNVNEMINYIMYYRSQEKEN